MDALVVSPVVVGMVLGLCWYLGLFDTVETGARMGNRAVERFEAEQINNDIKFYNSNEGKITDAEFKSAVATKEKYAQLRDL